mgnify:CR=1 FL=1
MIGDYYRYPVGRSYSDLQKVSLHRPDKAGTTWKGIAHAKLVAAFLDYVAQKDYEIRGLRYYLSRNDTDIAFSCNIIEPEKRTVPFFIEGKRFTMHPAFGFIASNSRRHRLTFYSGWSDPAGRAAFVGAKKVGPRYTTHAEGKEELQAALERWDDMMSDSLEIMNSLRTMRLSNRKIDFILIEAANERLSPWGRMARVLQKIQSYEGIITGWDLVMEFSKTVIMNPPIKQMNQLLGFAELILSEKCRIKFTRRPKIDDIG